MLGSGDTPPIEEAIQTLMSAVPDIDAKPVVLFPCLKLATKKLDR